MREHEKISMIKEKFVEHLCRGAETSIESYFPTRQKYYCGLFETTEIVLPRNNKIATLAESLPLNTTIASSELSSIVSDICGYQETRQRRWFAYGVENDVTNAVLEELKRWCHTFEEKKESETSIAEIGRRIKYIEAISDPALFPTRDWTRRDSQTMLGVLEKVRKQLLSAKTRLQNEKKVGELREKLAQLRTLAHTVVYQGIHYLTFVFRDTPHVNVNAGNVFTLQNSANREVKEMMQALTQTVSGGLLHALANHPLTSHGEHAARGRGAPDRHASTGEAGDASCR